MIIYPEAFITAFPAFPALPRSCKLADAFSILGKDLLTISFDTSQVDAVCRSLIDDANVNIQHVAELLMRHPELLACSVETIQMRVSSLATALQTHDRVTPAQ